MRGLALATLFLGVCLINPGLYTDPSVLLSIRSVVFFVAVIVIILGI